MTPLGYAFKFDSVHTTKIKILCILLPLAHRAVYPFGLFWSELLSVLDIG